MSDLKGEAGETLILRDLGTVDYTDTWHAMKDFTEQRNEQTPDEIWLLQHPRVFTQGQAGKAEHVLAPGDIPVIQVDRGGQVTYHGPGQLVGYLMIDLRRMGIGARDLVSRIENAIVATLAELNIESAPRPDAPGVYSGGKKIASLGLRIRHGRSFHGLALNIDMDLEPFQRINPCGYQGMEMTQVRNFADQPDFRHISSRMAHHLQQQLGYTSCHHATGFETAV
ncbi:lipoyl(octanoyl) transferase LipB [Ketobacter alkanivorans]|uniref:Octanoyltransferase n=1 Tax=Ketobacter alkanivorans TaxID=1917421 RepID=A0A2K9LNR7_9GAMM|nr:lipoyl(octanoyl) transferase LipB [Ketobacter alkanivorans]AUM13877.1 octanoyltransferase [Ketobacter alkanivorans]